MADYILMPTLGFDMEEGTMGAWIKQIGEEVAVGDVLAEIETDKVTQELQARHAGVLLATFANEGEDILVGSNLGVIGNADEDISGMTLRRKEGETRSQGEGENKSDHKAVSATPMTVVSKPTSDLVDSTEFPAGVKATPVARRIAAEKNISLQQVNGSGPGGRIRKADVEAFVPPAASTRPSSTIAVPSGPETEEVSISRLRKAIARRMTESKQTVPHFQVTSAIDMTDALAMRKQINAALPEGEKVSVNDMIVKGCGMALRQFPNVNSSWGGDKIIRNNRINVGTAVAIEGGLLTIVQQNTDMTALAQVARDNKAKIGRARSGKVHADDIQGSTFSVSNLGAFDVFEFIAIINPPEAAILAVGTANQEAVVRDGEVVIRNIMRVTISADHRVTDGVEAAQFLQFLKETLETPMKLLL